MHSRKMMYYPYLVCLVLSVSLASTFNKTCYKYNPLRINGTQNASELRCPNRCDCKYCLLDQHGEEFLAYGHNVYCTYLQLRTMPSVDTVPSDVMYYHLEHNNILTMKNNSFSTSTALEYLHMDKNELTYRAIESDAFRGLEKLKYLSLSENLKLGQLLAHWFVHLTSLESLHARSCGITTIDSDTFKHCKHLTKIDLTSNSIKSFPTNVFQNLPSLNYLYMDNNHLNYIPNQAFVGSHSLTKIVINDNLLPTISENVGIQNLSHLQLLSGYYNKFKCDCDLVWFRHWINETNVTVEHIDNTKCSSLHSKVYHKLMDFDPDKLQCSKLIMILKIAIPSASAGVAIVIIGFLLYYFRYDIRYWNQRRRLRKQYQQLDNQGPQPINGENIRYDAFVSYNSKDQQWILKVLQPSLETKRNFKLCVDYRDFIPGEAVVNNIADAVKYSRKVLLVVSKNFAKSEWCYFELEMARMRMFDNHEDILVVVLLEKVTAKDMPILLHKILTKKTYIEWEEHPEGQALFWAKLETALLSPNCHRDRLLDNPPN